METVEHAPRANSSPTAYTFRTPDAHTTLPANPPRRTLTGLTPAARTAALDDHRRHWLHLRTGGLTASDASTILGLNPHKSLTAVYAEKVHGYTARDDDLKRLGRDMEDIAVARFTEATGLPVRRAGLLANNEQPWMMATPDRLTGDGAGLEAKTTTERDHRHDWEDAPSPHAYTQVQWTMAVTGATHWWVAVLFRDTGRFTYYRVERDDGVIAVLVERAAAFWWGNVRQRCAPPLDGTESTLEATRHIHRTTDSDEAVDHGEDAAVLRRRESHIAAQKKHLEAEEKLVKSEMLAMGGSAGEVKANGKTVWTQRANGTFRSKDYAADHPDKAAEFTVKVEKLDARAALTHHPEAAAYVPRVIRPCGGKAWASPHDFTGTAPPKTTREQLFADTEPAA